MVGAFALANVIASNIVATLKIAIDNMNALRTDQRRIELRRLV